MPEGYQHVWGEPLYRWLQRVVYQHTGRKQQEVWNFKLLQR